MAQAILAARMPRSWHDAVEVSSAGTAAWDGMRAVPQAVSALADVGIELAHHRARNLTPEMIEDSDLVVAMKNAHREEILELSPASGGKVIALGELEPGRGDPDIADPIGGDSGVYRRTREELEHLVAVLIDYLAEKFELGK